MITALWYLGVSGAVLCGLTFFYGFEDARGGRVLFPRLRAGCDRALLWLWGAIKYVAYRFGGGFLKLLFYYGTHRVLKRMLRFMQSGEERIEHMLRQNKVAARKLSEVRERNHLDEIADHKEASALTEKQRAKLRSHQ